MSDKQSDILDDATRELRAQTKALLRRLKAHAHAQGAEHGAFQKTWINESLDEIRLEDDVARATAFIDSLRAQQTRWNLVALGGSLSQECEEAIRKLKGLVVRLSGPTPALDDPWRRARPGRYDLRDSRRGTLGQQVHLRAEGQRTTTLITLILLWRLGPEIRAHLRRHEMSSEGASTPSGQLLPVIGLQRGEEIVAAWIMELIRRQELAAALGALRTIARAVHDGHPGRETGALGELRALSTRLPDIGGAYHLRWPAVRRACLEQLQPGRHQDVKARQITELCTLMRLPGPQADSLKTSEDDLPGWRQAWAHDHPGAWPRLLTGRARQATRPEHKPGQDRGADGGTP